MVFGIVIPAAIVLGLGALVAVAVFVILRLRAGETLDLSFRTILIAYFRLMSIVSVLVLALGLTTLLKAGMSEPLGREFSYWMPPAMLAKPPPPPVRPGEPGPPPRSEPTSEQLVEQRQRQIRQVEQQFRSDVVQGTTMAMVGAILWPLHAWGRRRIARVEDAWSAFFARLHLTILLVLFSLVGIISLATAIYQVLRFILVPAEEYLPSQPPGESLAAAAVFVPLWIFYLVAALSRMRRERQ